MNQKQIAVRIPIEIDARLEALSAHTGRSKTFYVREALLEHLDDIEDLYIAEQRLLEVRAGRSKTYTTEELSKSLGLDN